MRRILQKVLPLIIAAFLMLGVGSCSSAGYTVTGKIEKGTLTVWLSPRITETLTGEEDWPQLLASYTGFSQDITYVSFKTENEFRQALAEKIVANEGPDLILASQNELNSKMFESEMLTDLTPFLDYACKSGKVAKDELMTNVMDLCKYDGKQYVFPFSYKIKGIMYSTENRGSDVLNLADQSGITPDELVQKVDAWVEKNGAENSYKVTGVLPPVLDAFENLIDYKNKTTRMDEDQIYKYFCKYVEYKKEEFTELKKHDTTALQFFQSYIYSNGFYLYQGDIVKYDIIGGAYKVLPLNTENKTGYEADINLLAAIPANSTKKEKAFAYISTTFSNSEWMEKQANNYNVGTSMMGAFPITKSYVKEKIENAPGLDNGIKEELYKYIIGHDFISTLQDAQIVDWFNEYCDEDPLTVHTVDEPFKVPTREEWDALKQKIETYLNE